ncbi:MAG: hypothetical protein KDC53_04410 [Saprospiraceae bacterium]|nr:hypothetical protein [Saprospiraceae bacterium]
MSESSSLKSVFSQIRYSLQTDGVQMILGFITSIILVRYLGPEGNGYLTKLTYSGNLILAIASFQFFRGIPYLYEQFGSKATSQWVTWGIMGTILISILIILLDRRSIGFFTFDNFPMLNCLLFIYVLFALGQKCLETYVQVHQSFRKWWTFQWIGNMGKLLITLFIAIKLTALTVNWQFFAGISSYLSGYLILLLIAWFTIHPKLRLGKPGRLFAQQAFHYAGSMWAINLLSILMINLPIWLIESTLAQDNLGVYGLALTLSGIPFTFTLSIKKVLLPYTIRVKHAYDDNCLRVIRIHNSVLLSICVIGGISGFYLLPLMYGSAFKESAVLLPILLVWTYFIGVSTILNTLFEARNELNLILAIYLIITCSILLSLYLFHNGLASIAIIFSANGILMSMLNIYHVVYHTPNKLSQLFLFHKSDYKFNNSPTK